jgi:hypothetical protein
MKTKGFWVIKTSAGGYWCSGSFDSQIRKAHIYTWKEKAEEAIETFIKRKYLPSDITYEVVAVAEPKELKATEAEWIKIDADLAVTKYVCSACDFNVTSWFGIHDEYICERSVLMMKFCPHCGKFMINARGNS